MLQFMDNIFTATAAFMILRKKTTSIEEDLKSGDVDAYESIFKKYYRPLVVFAIKYINNTETAKEIVQDFFVKLYEKRYSINIDTSLKSYLYKSVYNACLNYISQNETRNRHFKNMASQTEDSVIDDHVAAVELQNRIYECIESMPEQCKKIFKMNRLEGLKNEQIAQKLNLSKRTVETQISKALKILRKELNDYVSGVL